MTGRGERGSGLLSTTLGVAVLIALLGLSANVALGLWTRTTVESVAEDAARRVAQAPQGTDLAVAASAAAADARRLLGRYGRQVRLDWIELGPGSVRLRVRAPGATLLPRMVGRTPVVGALDRVVVVRRERP
jgi:hypothetical protein